MANAAVVVGLDPGDFGAAQAAGATNLDALGALVHRGLYRLLHGAAEGDAAFELEGDILGHQLRVDVRLLDLLDVHIDLLAGHLAEFFLELVDFRALAADDHSGTSGVDRHAAATRGPFNVDLRHGRTLQLALEMAANLFIFDQQVGEVLFAGIPARGPVLVDGDAEADRIRFLTHRLTRRKERW